jgi:uncharacterized repeat protein (TIGR01451 family)
VDQETILPLNSTDPGAGGFDYDSDGGDGSTDPIGVIPPLSAYGNRSLQTTKTVSNSNPEPGESVLYTIKILNRDDSNTGLTKINESLPPGFSYDCDGPDNILSLPEVESQVIVPHHDDCPDDDDTDFDRHMPPGTTLPPSGVATLTFTAITSMQDGTYSNSVHVDPGGNKTTSGRTAIVQIGDQAGLCASDAVSVGKTVETAVLVSTNTLSGDYVYTFDIDFNITLDNIGSTSITIKEYIDLLPTGFSYVSTSPNGDITEIPHNLHHENQVDRQRVTWKFNPDVELSPGESQSLIFTTTASLTRGNYWSDLLVDFAGGTFSEDRYSWPTALISVRDVYTVTATDNQGNEQVIAAEVWLGDENGSIATWTLP